VFNDTAGPRTRSTRASRPAQFSMVPLLAKLTKLLLMEVANLMEFGEDDSDEDYDSEGEIDSQDGSLNGSNGGKNGVELSSLLDEGAELIDLEDEDEDPDAKLDPINAVDLKKYLISFLREFSSQPVFEHFLPHLNPTEALTLQHIQQIQI